MGSLTQFGALIILKIAVLSKRHAFKHVSLHRGLDVWLLGLSF